MADGFRWGIALQNFIFPPSCYSCGAPVPQHADLLCAACRERVVPVTVADPLYHLAHARLCGDGLCSGLAALHHFAAQGPVQDLLHALKYGGLTGVGRSLGVRLGSVIAGVSWSAEIEIVVPLPLFHAKQRERGYNQTESIARGIARSLPRPVRRRLVKRSRWTDSQTTLGFAARQMNVNGAFVVPRSKTAILAGKTILLVDDVVTTGATTRACAEALRKGGAAAVYVAAVALAEQLP
jgi:competence protein ComFC